MNESGSAWLERAKERMSEAAEAVLANHPNAAAIGEEAIEELTSARAALALLDEEQRT